MHVWGGMARYFTHRLTASIGHHIRTHYGPLRARIGSPSFTVDAALKTVIQESLSIQRLFSSKFPTLTRNGTTPSSIHSTSSLGLNQTVTRRYGNTSSIYASPNRGMTRSVHSLRRMRTMNALSSRTSLWGCPLR